MDFESICPSCGEADVEMLQTQCKWLKRRVQVLSTLCEGSPSDPDVLRAASCMQKRIRWFLKRKHASRSMKVTLKLRHLAYKYATRSTPSFRAFIGRAYRHKKNSCITIQRAFRKPANNWLLRRHIVELKFEAMQQRYRIENLLHTRRSWASVPLHYTHPGASSPPLHPPKGLPRRVSSTWRPYPKSGRI